MLIPVHIDTCHQHHQNKTFHYVTNRPKDATLVEIKSALWHLTSEAVATGGLIIMAEVTNLWFPVDFALSCADVGLALTRVVLHCYFVNDVTGTV